MTIIRSPRVQRDFTIISNSVCLDARLSMRALGLLVRLLSRPDDWQTNSTTLAREFGVGREQMQGVLRELSAANYMRLMKNRSDDGTLSSLWVVYEEPQPVNRDGGDQRLETRMPAAPSALIRTDLPRTDTKSASPAGDAAPAGFAEFWEAWPASPRKVGKGACASKWKAKKLHTHVDAILAHVDAMKSTEQWARGFEPSPLTYINQERWGDGVPEGANSNSFAGVL